MKAARRPGAGQGSLRTLALAPRRVARSLPAGKGGQDPDFPPPSLAYHLVSISQLGKESPALSSISQRQSPLLPDQPQGEGRHWLGRMGPHRSAARDVPPGTAVPAGTDRARLIPRCSGTCIRRAHLNPKSDTFTTSFFCAGSNFLNPADPYFLSLCVVFGVFFLFAGARRCAHKPVRIRTTVFSFSFPALGQQGLKVFCFSSSPWQ